MSYYPQQTQHPPLPPPWYAEWDQRDQRYVFINPQTGERTFQHPHPTYQPQGGYPPQGGYGGQGYPQQQTYGQQQGYQQAGYVQQSSPPPPPQPKDNHNALKYGALGAVGGLVAGGLAMHEADKIHQHWDEDKERIEDHLDYDRDRVEDHVRYDKDRVEDFVDGRDRWDRTEVVEVEDGRDRWDRTEVVEVEDVPYERREYVEDVPDDVAYLEGRREGEEERYDDNIQAAYDDGREDGRYDDDGF